MFGRRRRRLNEALHELRRPLQALELLAGSDPRARESLRQARYALRELDREINGGPPRRQECFELADLVESARERWSTASVEIDARGRGAVRGDGARVASALDNLIANALEHGSAPVRVEVAREAELARLRVADAGPASGPASVGAGRGRGRSRADGRQGHGLRIVRRVVAEAGGTLTPPHPLDGRTVAEIELPASPSTAPTRA